MSTESATPGSDIPSDRAVRPNDGTAEVTGVSPDSGGLSRIEKIASRSVKITRVVVDGDVSDYEFNIELEGNQVFGSNQAPQVTNQDEEFFPDDANKEFAGGSSALIEVDITSTGSAGSVAFTVEYEFA